MAPDPSPLIAKYRADANRGCRALKAPAGREATAAEPALDANDERAVPVGARLDASRVGGRVSPRRLR